MFSSCNYLRYLRRGVILLALIISSAHLAHLGWAQQVESRSGALALKARRALTIQTKKNRGGWKSSTRVTLVEGDQVSLRVKLKRRNQAQIKWYLVFPDLSIDYKNANHPWEENAYQWVGYTTIQYHRIELSQFAQRWEIQPFSVPDLWAPVRAWLKARGEGDKIGFYHAQLGTFYFQAVVQTPRGLLRSAGIEDQKRLGISPRVLRVVRQRDRSYLGYLTGFFNVPGIFGSVTAQSRNYLGVDCADVLVAAYSHWKRRPPKKNYNVSMLVHMHKAVARVTLSQGRFERELRWGNQVRPGDFIAVKYEGARRFQHIGALYEDHNRDGILNGGDLVIHAGPLPLSVDRFDAGLFDGELHIFRPRGRL